MPPSPNANLLAEQRLDYVVRVPEALSQSQLLWQQMKVGWKAAWVVFLVQQTLVE